MIAYATEPSANASSTPVTVIVWGVAKLAGENTTWSGATVPSPVSVLDKPTVTADLGGVLRTTWNVALPPFSVVIRPLVGNTVTPGPSLSTVSTLTLTGATCLYSLELVEPWTATTTGVTWAPSTSLSSTPVTVTVWAVAQFWG